MNPENNLIVSYATDSERALFFWKTYTHVAFAILLFIVLESVLLKVVPAEFIASMMGGQYVWLFILGLFWLGSSLSNKLVFHPNRDRQYLGLGIFIIF